MSRALPYDDFSDAVKQTVIRAIREAWQDVQRTLGDSVGELSEPEITAYLQLTLNRMRELPDDKSVFPGSAFCPVERDASELSYQGGHIEKKPDLKIVPIELLPGTNRAADRAFFLECKRLRTKADITRYCRDGISRFVKGEYAGAMKSAGMVGYLGDEIVGTLRGELRERLDASRLLEEDPYSTEELPGMCSFCAKTDRSSHGRNWTYGNTGRSPGAIILFHLWLGIHDNEVARA